MLQVEENVRHDVIKLVPASVINEITCFAFYDDHPRDKLCLDIIVCTKNSEIIEYYNREPILSTLSRLSTSLREIKILRNNKCELFYLVASQFEIIIFSRRASLQIHKIVTNVERYDFADPSCSGNFNLRVFCSDDAVPLLFNENFESIDNSVDLSSPSYEDDIPVVQQLKCKLIEAQYTVQCNEKTYEDLVKLRQKTLSVLSQRTTENSDTLCKNKESGVLSLQKPWVSMCSKQIVIAVKATNKHATQIENIYMLLDTRISSLTYTTKVFKQDPKPPYWKEMSKNIIENSNSAYIIVVINMSELLNSVISQISFKGVISYQNCGTGIVIPFQGVEVSAVDMMGEGFDVLSKGNPHDTDHVTLALLATSEKRDLHLHHIPNDGDNKISDIAAVFIQYLNMEKFQSNPNVVIHRKSPYHVLNGVMVVFEETLGNVYNVTVYSRTQSQILALIHFMNDAIPYRIIVTTPQQKLIAKTADLEHHTESTNNSPKLNFKEYGQSIARQSTIILQHFDTCMMKMNENKSQFIQNKIGKEIDLYAAGKEEYEEFRSKLLDEAEKGIESLLSDENEVCDDDVMVIDD